MSWWYDLLVRVECRLLHLGRKLDQLDEQIEEAGKANREALRRETQEMVNALRRQD